MTACPACNKNNDDGSLECKHCGVIFEKWSRRALGNVNQASPLPIEPIKKTPIERLAYGLLFGAGLFCAYILIVSVLVRFPDFYQMFSSKEFKVVLLLSGAWAAGIIINKAFKKMPVKVNGGINSLNQPPSLARKLLAINAGLLTCAFFLGFGIEPVLRLSFNGLLFGLVIGMVGIFLMLGSAAIIIIAVVGMAKSFSKDSYGNWTIDFPVLIGHAAIPIVAWFSRVLFMGLRA